MVAEQSRHSEFRRRANALRYAAFPQTRDWRSRTVKRVAAYDTGDHRIFGVAQAQSRDQTLTFTRQTGLVRVSELPKVDF